jgi:thiol peroxidase
MTEAKNTITISGNQVALVGGGPGVGESAPDFEAVNNDMSPFRLSEIKGKVLVICSVGSLDTSVCDTEVRKFNEQVSSLGDDVKVLVISMDLPSDQKRW